MSLSLALYSYYDLQSSNEDEVIPSILDTVHPDEVDGLNQERRSANRQSSVFAVYPLPDDVRLGNDKKR